MRALGHGEGVAHTRPRVGTDVSVVCYVIITLTTTSVIPKGCIGKKNRRTNTRTALDKMKSAFCCSLSIQMSHRRHQTTHTQGSHPPLVPTQRVATITWVLGRWVSSHTGWGPVFLEAVQRTRCGVCWAQFKTWFDLFPTM